MILSPFLRTVLKLDGLSCLGLAALILPLSVTLSPRMGLPAALLTGAAATLIPIGLFILALGLQTRASRALVMLVIVGNVGWAAASLLVAAESAEATALGRALVSAQGLAVLGMAALEWVGLRASQQRSEAAVG